MFCRKGILRNILKFTGKHLHRSLFLNKVAGLGRFCKNTFSYKTLPGAASVYCFLQVFLLLPLSRWVIKKLPRKVKFRTKLLLKIASSLNQWWHKAKPKINRFHVRGQTQKQSSRGAFEKGVWRIQWLGFIVTSR